VVGVVGWDHASSSGAGDVVPPFDGFHLVVMRAGPVDTFGDGLLGVGPVVAVVELEVFGPVTSFDAALR